MSDRQKLGGLDLPPAGEKSANTALRLFELLRVQGKTVKTPEVSGMDSWELFRESKSTFDTKTGVNVVLFSRSKDGEAHRARWVPSPAPKGSSFREKVAALDKTLLFLAVCPGKDEQEVPRWYHMASVADVARRKGVSDNYPSQVEKGDDRSVAVDMAVLASFCLGWTWSKGSGAGSLFAPSPIACDALLWGVRTLAARPGLLMAAEGLPQASIDRWRRNAIGGGC